MQDLEARLVHIVRTTPWFMRVLRAVRGLHLPDAGVGGGVVRTLVWDHLHGYTQPTPLRDVDVVYFDPSDLSWERDQALTQRLHENQPDYPWEVKNQAGIHLWFEQHFGYAVEPVHSLEEAVATWPEPATAVTVCLLDNDEVQCIAPLGLEDLFDMIIRRNPRRVSIKTYQQRIVQKRYTEKWPRVRVLPD